MTHSPIKIEKYECYASSDPDLFSWECSCGEDGDNHETFADALDEINAHINVANNEEINEVSKELFGIANYKGHLDSRIYDWDALAKHVIAKGYKL